jgi:exopolysaccharide biosynthesis protein
MLRTPILHLLAALTTAVLTHAASPWINQQPDLETISGPVLLVSQQNIVLSSIRARIGAYEPRIVRAASFGRRSLEVARLGKESGALACINGSFFDEQEDPLGLVVSGGTTFHAMQYGGTLLTGVFFASRTNIGIVPRNALNPAPVLEALQGGPRLVTGGKVLPGLRDSEKSQRSAVCVDRQRNIVLTAVSTPITLLELQDLLVDPTYHCTDALNLDGGSSTHMYFSPRVLPDVAPFSPPLDRKAVPVALCLFTKKKI